MADEAVVEVTEGDADDQVTELRWALHQAVFSGARYVVVDVTRARRLSSATLGALLYVHRRCRARGGGVVIRGATRAITDLLRRNGLDRVFIVERAGHRRSGPGAGREPDRAGSGSPS